MLGIVLTTGTIIDVVAGDIRVGIRIPLEIDGPRLGIGGEGREKGEGAEDREDRAGT